MNNKFILIFAIAFFLSVTACGTSTTPKPKVCQASWDTGYNDSITKLPTDNPFTAGVNPYDFVYGLIMGVDCSAASPSDTCYAMQSCLSSGWRPMQDTRQAAIITPFILPTKEPTPTFGPTPTPEIGFARSRPAPLGDSIIVGDEAIHVANVIAPANNLVDSMSAQMFPLAANQEYVAVEISIVCNKTQDETCMGVDFSYSIVGSSGQVHDATVIQVLNECIQCDTVYGGGALKGYVVFIVDKSETNLVLVAERYPNSVYLLVKP